MTCPRILNYTPYSGQGCNSVIVTVKNSQPKVGDQSAFGNDNCLESESARELQMCMV